MVRYPLASCWGILIGFLSMCIFVVVGKKYILLCVCVCVCVGVCVC